MPAGSFTLDFSLKRVFFDRPEIERRLGKAKARSLSFTGRDVRQAARALIGKQAKRAKPRPPGKPPKNHVPDGAIASIRNILYANQGVGVIIGPVGLNQVNQNAIDLGSFTVPEIQEFGGQVLIREESYDDGQTWFRRDLRRAAREWKKYRTRRATYPARPYMNPALRKVIERYRKRGKMPGLSIGPSSSVNVGPTPLAA